MSGYFVNRHKSFTDRSEAVLTAYDRADAELSDRIGQAAAAATATSPAGQRVVLAALRSQIADAHQVLNGTLQQADELSDRTTPIDYPSDDETVKALDDYTDDGSGMDPDRKHYDDLPGQGPVPPFMPNPYDTPNCTGGEVLGIQGDVFVSGLQPGGALTAAPTGLGVLLMPFELRDFWNSITGAKERPTTIAWVSDEPRRH